MGFNVVVHTTEGLDQEFSIISSVTSGEGRGNKFVFT